MPLTVARIAPCPPWRTLAWAAALVATLAVGCSKADVDLSGFNLTCAAETDCPDDRTCGKAGICVARAGVVEGGSGEGGEGEGEGGSGGQGGDVGTGPGDPGQGEGEGEGEDPPDEPFDCEKRCAAMVVSCPEEDEGSAADQEESCQLICEFFVRQIDPSVAGCIFDHFPDGECDGDDAALLDCASTCQDDSACAAAGEGQRCTFLGGDEVGVCAQPTDCGEALRCTQECPDHDGGCVANCLDKLRDSHDLRAGVVALACEADCGQDSEHPVCDRGRHQDGECEWPAAVCLFGGANDDFACRDIVSCMLNTCNDSGQDCRDLCGGGPVEGQDWPDSHPAGWPALDNCMDNNCPEGMSAEECFREKCGGFVEDEDDGCGYPIHEWPPERPADCWSVYDCFVGCSQEHEAEGEALDGCKQDCGHPASDDDRRRSATLFGCMKPRCSDDMYGEDCANSWCGQQWQSCHENRDPPTTPCMGLYFCLQDCEGEEGACESACFEGPSDRAGELANDLNACTSGACHEDRRDMSCAQTACREELDQCNNFMGLDCADSWDCGGGRQLMCATDPSGDRYCTKPCDGSGGCPGRFTCVTLTTDEDEQVEGCRRP